MSLEAGALNTTQLAAPAAPALSRELGLADVTLFAITCVTSARWVPIAAHAGPGSITLWLLAAVFFVVPLTLAVATLVVKYPGVGGLYIWTRNDFGPWHGFLCFWLYWVGIAFLFPTAAMLFTQVGYSMMGPTISALGQNRGWLLAGTILLIWVAMGSNLLGMKAGKWTENIGGVATWLVGMVLVAVAAKVYQRHGSATPPDVVPVWSWGTVSFWSAIAYATSGMEGPGMMSGEMRDPERVIRRAGWIASAFATVFYISATAAFLVVLPPGGISELNGFAEVADSAGRVLGAHWLSPVIGLLVLASGLGLVGGLGTATSRMPFVAAADGLLPAAFARTHPRWGTPHVATFALGIAATLFVLMYQLGDTMRAAYQALVSMMVITGFVPYLYLFGSSWKAGRRASAASGLAVTVLALCCSIVPSSDITNVWLFEAKLLVGSVIVLLSAWLLYRRSATARAGIRSLAAVMPVETGR